MLDVVVVAEEEFVHRLSLLSRRDILIDTRILVLILVSSRQVFVVVRRVI